MTVTCSKGTYIRTLCHDIGEKLGICACMEELTRIRVGIFEIQDALRLSEAEELQKQNEVTAALSEAAGNFGRQTEAAREELARRIAWRAAAPARTKEAPADQKCQKEQERLAQLSEEQFAQAAKETEKQLASENAPGRICGI